MDTAKYEIWQEHKKCNNFSSRVEWAKGSQFMGRQMQRILGLEFIPSYKNCLLGNDAIFG